MNFNNKEQVIKNKNFSTADAGWTKRIDQQGHSKEAKGESCKSGFIKGDGVCLFYTWNCYWYVGGSRGGRDFVLYKKSGLYFSSNFITPNRLPFAPPPLFPQFNNSAYILPMTRHAVVYLVYNPWKTCRSPIVAAFEYNWWFWRRTILLSFYGRGSSLIQSGKKNHPKNVIHLRQNP